MSPRRVVLLTPYTDPVKGGISSYTRELASAYGRRGISCIGFAADGADNSSFVVIPHSRVRFIARSVRGLAELRPDLINAHSQHWYVLLTGLIGKILCPSAVMVVTLHTPVESNQNRFKDALIRLLLRFSDGVVLVSKAMKDSIRLPPSIRQAVILAAPEELATCRELTPEGSAKRRDIVFAGPLVWSEKVAGVLLLVEAFAAVSGLFPDWRLLILGDGPLKASVEKRVREVRLPGRIVLKGFVDSVFDEIANAAIYAQISLQEGLPLALLDAMSIGTPVIATSVGGIPEVVRHNETGYLVEPRVEEVAAGLRCLMGDARLRLTLAKAAKSFVSSELSWDKVADQYSVFAAKGIS